jgi:hypothetical protein
MVENYLNFRVSQMCSWVVDISTALQMFLPTICTLQCLVHLLYKLTTSIYLKTFKIFKQHDLGAQGFQIRPWLADV